MIDNVRSSSSVANFDFFSNKSLPARLKATNRQEASRRDKADLTKTEKDIG